ncbi:MAG: hypothetical protein HQ464_03175 [Planctomycetes bacterium]|nr:hypothetical protein [Planctomycetota bacterium]
MSDTLSETEGCNLLTRLFRARGYSIVRNVLFREYGVEFHMDGWDANARVGFEFLSSEDDDHDDLSLDEFKALTAAQQRGELSVFVIDEVEPVSVAALALEANEFLDEMASAAQARLKAGVRKAAAKSRKPTAQGKKTKPAAKKATASRNKAAIAKKVSSPKKTVIKKKIVIKKKTSAQKKTRADGAATVKSKSSVRKQATRKAGRKKK